MARKRTKQDDDSRELLTRSGPRVVWAPPDVVVGTHTFAGLRLQAATCGELLGRLLGRVQHGTPYLRAEAVSWISAMLCDFLDFEFVGAGWFGRDRRGPIRDSPLDSIEVYARHWIQGEHLQSPALQSHALGMLEFGARPGSRGCRFLPEALRRAVLRVLRRRRFAAVRTSERRRWRT